MVERKISVRRYFAAGVITSLVFVTGLLLGVMLTNERANVVETETHQQKLDLDSVQLQYNYLQSFSNKENGCSAALKALGINLGSLEDTRRKLEGYISQSLNDNEEFNILKREYMLSELRYWLLYKETEQLCESEAVSLLYFYSNKGCSDCASQGVILTNIKEKFDKSLLIFSIDADFEQEPLIGILRENYKINELPAIVLGDLRIEGLQTEDELFPIICELLNGNITVCQKT